MYRKIFCPIDGSEPSNNCVGEVIRFAKDQQAQLCFLHIVDIGPLIMYAPVVESVFETMRTHGRDVLDAAVAQARLAGIDAERKMTEIMAGRTAAVIVAEAEKYGADLIVMGTHGRRGVGRLLMGSDAATVVGTSKVPVLLVK